MIRSIAIIAALAAGPVGAESNTSEIEPTGGAPEVVGVSPPLRPDVFAPVPTGPAPDAMVSQDVRPQMNSDALLEPAKARMRERVAQCWNVGALAAQGEVPAVTIAFSMTSDGRPITDSFKVIESSATEPDATSMAFRAAQLAVIRCAGAGYELPADLVARWQNVQITFDPAGVTTR